MDKEIRPQELNDEELENVHGGREQYYDIICDRCGHLTKGWPERAWVAKGCQNCGYNYGYFLVGSTRCFLGWK